MTERGLDELDLRRLIAEYADGVTRRDWDGLADLFTDGAVLHLDLVDRGSRDLVGPAAILSFIGESVQRFDFFEFVALNVLVTVPADAPDEDGAPIFDADLARMRTFMCEVRHHGPDAEGAGGWSTAYGVYQDTAVRTDGVWRFSERGYRSLARTDPATAPGGVVLPFPDLPRRP